MARAYLLLIAIAFCGYALAEDPPPLLDRALFFSDPDYSSGQISPDGAYISFVRPFNGVKNIWIKGINEPIEAARPVTSEACRPVGDYFWSGDSRYLLYFREVHGPEQYHLFSVRIPESLESLPVARDLSPSSVSSPKILAIPKDGSEFVYVGLVFEKSPYRDVYRINLNTGERTRVFSNKDRILDWYFDQECHLRLGKRTSKDRGQELLRVDGKSLIPVLSYGHDETFDPIRFHEDGKRVYVRSSVDVDCSRLVLFNVETRECTECDRDPEGTADLFTVFFEEGEPVATCYVGERARLYCKSEKIERLYLDLQKRFPKEEIRFGSVSADRRFMLILVCSDIEPGVVYLYDEKRDTLTFVYRASPSLPSQDLAFVKPVQYRARDGRTIAGYLTLPKGLPEYNLPVVVFPHGGPSLRDYWRYNHYVQFLANRGYAVFQMNFRGSSGYGKEFLRAGMGQWGDAMQDDISDGVAYLIKEGIADEKKIAIFGSSYGGFAALAGLAFTPQIYCCGISLSGRANLLSLLGSPYRARHLLVGDVRCKKDRIRMKRFSPLYSAEKIRAPLLLVHGTKDPRVPKEGSEQLAERLKELNRTVTYLPVPGEGHFFVESANRIAVAAAIEQFLSQHLGGRCQGESSRCSQKSPYIIERN